MVGTGRKVEVERKKETEVKRKTGKGRRGEEKPPQAIRRFSPDPPGAQSFHDVSVSIFKLEIDNKNL